MDAFNPVWEPENLPANLRALKRWARWWAEWDGKKWQKRPIASTKKIEAWGAFNERSVTGKYKGLGLLLTGYHDLVAVDIDKCLDEEGRPSPLAQEIMARVPSYTEVSVSGRGLRIIAWGSIPRDVQRHDIGLEIYNGHSARFVTMSGDIWPGAYETVEMVDFGSLFDDFAGSEANYSEQSEVPDLLESVEIPPNLNAEARQFLETGEADDRSGALQFTTARLYEAGLNEQEVLSALVLNEFAMEVALDHRRQDWDRAVVYLWDHHVCKAKGKARAVATVADFDDATSPAFLAVKRLAVMDPMDYEMVRKEEAAALGVRATALDEAIKRFKKRGEVAARKAQNLPNFARREDGAIINNMSNNVIACSSKMVIGYEIAWDTFRDEIMYAVGKDEWQTFRDEQYVSIRIAMDAIGFEFTTDTTVRAAVFHVAKANAFDSAQLWLNGLEWDGVPRVSKFHARYLGAEDNEWAEAVSEYMWTAMAGRVLLLGCKADMVPVWISEEGRRKSTMASLLVPSREFFTEMSFHEKETDLSRKMRGCLVAELAELAGMTKKDVEPVKYWITKTHEDWTPKFKEFNTTFARRLIFIGTTNQERFLIDTGTGNRRWLPIHISRGDTRALVADRDQLWAEAKVLFEAKGEVMWERAESIGKKLHLQHTLEEPWTDDIRIWLHTPDDLVGGRPVDRDHVTVREVLRDCLRIDIARKTRSDEMRIGNALRALGYSRERRMVNGAREYVYVPLLP